MSFLVKQVSAAVPAFSYLIMSDHILFSIILFFLFLLIFLIKKYRLWKAENKTRLHTLVKQIATSNRMQLSVTDHFREKTLGFDMAKQKVLYIDLKNNIIRIVDMEDIDNCKLIKKQLSIQMELIYHDQDKAPLTITFFNKISDRKWRRNKLEEKARYWEVLMNGILHKNLHAEA